MENELVIFKDLPDKSTPLNAHNLNHNFDVFKNQINTEAGKIDTTLQDIAEAKTNLENDITTKTNTLEKNITDATNELQSEITTATENLESNITEKTTKLNDDITTKTTKLETDITEATENLQQQITTSNTELTSQITNATNDLTKQISDSNTQLTEQITKAREDLMTEIGKQIASISSLSILIVDTLPTENISETTIYLIKPENLPSSVELGANTVVQAQDLQSVPTVKPQVFNLNGEPLYREMFVKSEDIKTKASIQAIAESIPDDEYYIACFWVKTSPDGSTHKWVAVGTTKIDLSQYSTTDEMNKAINDKATEITNSLKALIPTKVSQLQNDEGYLKSFTEIDPTVPSHVKSITTTNISDWNGKPKLIKANSEEDAITKSAADPTNIYYWVEE